MNVRAKVVAVLLSVLSLVAIYFVVGFTDGTRFAPPPPSVSAPVKPATETSPLSMPSAVTRPPSSASEPKAVVLDDVCGASEQERRRLDHESVWEHLARLTRRGVQKWQTALAASPDPRSRALSLALAGVDLAPPPVSDPTSPRMEPSKDTEPINSLVLLALETNDPAIYALALAQCRTMDREMAPGPCQGLSFEHWSRIDADNAAPWMNLAVRAQRAGDPQGTDAALARAAAATRFDGYSSAILSAGLDGLPSDMNPLERSIAYSRLNSVGWLTAPIRVVSLCEGPALENASRRAACTAITQRLADQGSTVIDQSVASILAQRLDLPAELREKLRNEHRVLLSAMSTENPYRDLTEDRGLDCQRVGEFNRRIDAAMAAQGNERAMFRMLSEAKEAAASQ